MPEIKVATHHLQREAYLYIRQSSLRQVYEHSESTKRQYDLRGRAVALGWTPERIRTTAIGERGGAGQGGNRDGVGSLTPGAQ